MKDLIKNSIIVAFIIFGLVALISSSNTSPAVIQEETPESLRQFCQTGNGEEFGSDSYRS